MLTTGIFSIFWGWEEASDSLTVSIIVMLVIGPLTIGAYYLVLNAIRGLMLALVIYLDGLAMEVS